METTPELLLLDPNITDALKRYLRSLMSRMGDDSFCRYRCSSSSLEKAVETIDRIGTKRRFYLTSFVIDRGSKGKEICIFLESPKDAEIVRKETKAWKPQNWTMLKEDASDIAPGQYWTSMLDKLLIGVSQTDLTPAAMFVSDPDVKVRWRVTIQHLLAGARRGRFIDRIPAGFEAPHPEPFGAGDAAGNVSAPLHRPVCSFRAKRKAERQEEKEKKALTAAAPGGIPSSLAKRALDVEDGGPEDSPRKRVKLTEQETLSENTTVQPTARSFSKLPRSSAATSSTPRSLHARATSAPPSL